jgi:hypothetical protein
MVHLFDLLAASCSSLSVVSLVGKFEPARLLTVWAALWKARQEDVPAIMESAAKWQSPPRAKRR